jgi:hypothetical protein
MEDAFLPSCCPLVDRIEGRHTRDGLAIVDLHPHRDMLRGVVLLPSGRKTLNWLRGGRLTAAAETPFDIRRRA